MSSYAGLLSENVYLASMCSALATPTTTNVLLASVVIAPANPNRKGLIIWNNSSNSVYISYANSASSATCTRIIPTFASYEPTNPTCYTGVISAIRNAGSGTVTVWELI